MTTDSKPLADDPDLDDIRDLVEARRRISQGMEFGAAGLFEEATVAFDAALKISPTCAEAWAYRGLAFEQMRQFDAAYASYAQAVVLTPLYPEPRERIAEIGPMLAKPSMVPTPWIERPEPRQGARYTYELRKRLGFRADWEKAQPARKEQDLRAELRRAPDSAELAIQLARCVRASGRLLEAEHFLRYAMALEPWSGEAAVLLCTVLETQSPGYPTRKIARASIDAGAVDERLPFFGWWNACNACDWADASYWRTMALDVARRRPLAIPPLAALLLADDPALQRASAEANTQWNTHACVRVKRPARRQTASPITLGYLSADFHDHPVARLITEVFELHDRSRFRVLGYGVFNGKDSDIRRRVRSSFDTFTDLFGRSSTKCVEQITRDGVDILIDLTGHTENAPMQIVARKPAPVQVNYLGYPGTSGNAAMDYIVVDKTVVPHDQQRWFNEALVYMPDCYQANDRKRNFGIRVSRMDLGLPPEGVVYCSFNESRKITPELFAAWMRILARVPGSVLWLSIKTNEVAENLRRGAANAGIASERLIFAERVPRHEDHMSRYLLCDFFLDTVAYNGHTTTSDALWAGCPGVALLGKTYPTRVAASLLQRVGLSELVVHSLRDYEDIAVRAGLDVDLRHTWRARLETARSMSPLFDTPRFVRHLEWAFEHMWSEYREGRAPASFEVPALSF